MKNSNNGDDDDMFFFFESSLELPTKPVPRLNDDEVMSMSVSAINESLSDAMSDLEKRSSVPTYTVVTETVSRRDSMRSVYVDTEKRVCENDTAVIVKVNTGKDIERFYFTNERAARAWIREDNDSAGNPGENGDTPRMLVKQDDDGDDPFSDIKFE